MVYCLRRKQSSHPMSESTISVNDIDRCKTWRTNPSPYFPPPKYNAATKNDDSRTTCTVKQSLTQKD
jgi:hypothetical protein